MSLLNAPEYDERGERRKTGLLIGIGVALLLAVAIGIGGYLMGHGWFYTNLRAERRVDNFFKALEAKDYSKAYGIWMNDPNWEQHPQKYDYSIKRFTEDWTTESPIGGPVQSHHVDISKTDGTGPFGTGIIVAVRVNDGRKVFMWYDKRDGTLTYPAPHELGY